MMNTKEWLSTRHTYQTEKIINIEVTLGYYEGSEGPVSCFILDQLDPGHYSGVGTQTTQQQSAIVSVTPTL